jgi:hypothetical protein
MGDWRGRLRGDPLPWLLEGSGPAVRHLALRDVLQRPSDDPDLVAAREAGTREEPIASILAAQHAEGWWAEPGPGYSPKYTGTVWQLIFLDQLGADPANPGIRRACEYVLAHTQTRRGGFGAWQGRAREAPPPPASAIHCLNGNLVRALIGFGWLDDPRVQRAIDWEAAATTGEGEVKWSASTPGPGFRCGANYGEPCAWGAVKALLALARVPADRRSPTVATAIDASVEFLLSRDPAVADYPMPPGNAAPSSSWFRLGFPSGYVADVLQVLEALMEAGAGRDPRLDHALEWLLAQQDEHGRWANRYAYAGKMVVDIDRPGEPSPWVTLRVCRVLAATG